MASSPEAIGLNEWHHMAGTNDGANLKIYVDAHIKDSEPSAGLSGGSFPAHIGYDALTSTYFNGLIVSRDPVAADRVALEALEKMRKENDMPPLAETGRQVKYIQKADEIGLGVGDLTKIDLQIAKLGPDGTITGGGDL